MLGHHGTPEQAMERLRELGEQRQADVAAARSARREVRNPVLSLPSVQRLLTQETFTRADLIAILLEASADAAEKAQKSWLKNKGPMAAYWKATGVYMKHFKNVLRLAERGA